MDGNKIADNLTRFISLCLDRIHREIFGSRPGQAFPLRTEAALMAGTFYNLLFF
jgi:hypothetical protein